MTNTVISVEHLSKSYNLGQIGTGTLSRDINVWWAKVRGKPNPMLRIGEKDHGNRDGETIWALTDVNFTVEQGEVLGIIGRNGAGKSTLLKILSRVTAPTNGHARVKGRIASLLEVGTGFHPDLTGRENIYMNGAILGMSRKEIASKLDEIVAFAEIAQFVDTPVKRYSSGMYVRLAFSVAAHMNADVLLVDEVLSVGDMSFQKKSMQKMKEVTGSGRTVLFVSHNMTLIRSMCDVCILLNGGNLFFHGEPDAAVFKYLATDQKGPLFRIITDSDHAYGVGKVRVKSISLMDETGNICNEIRYHQPIKIHVEIEILSHVESGTFSMSVITEEGVRLWMTHTLDKNNEYIELIPGNYVIEVFLENNLHPGNYMIEFGGHQLPGTLGLCHISDAIHFAVSDFGYSPQDQFNFHNRTGLVDAVSTWTIQPKVSV